MVSRPKIPMAKNIEAKIPSAKKVIGNAIELQVTVEYIGINLKKT